VELRQLEYFVAVAEHLHFGRAAAALSIGQPAVSQQVARLERELGVGLFDRSGRTVQLTETGRRLLPEARATLAAVERVRAVAAAPPAGPVSRVLRLGSSTGLGDRLSRVLQTLAGQQPAGLTGDRARGDRGGPTELDGHVRAARPEPAPAAAGVPADRAAAGHADSAGRPGGCGIAAARTVAAGVRHGRAGRSGSVIAAGPICVSISPAASVSNGTGGGTVPPQSGQEASCPPLLSCRVPIPLR